MAKKKLVKSKRWCALFGFNRDDHSDVGYLAFKSKANAHIAKTTLGSYMIVEDVSEAKCFPCKNYDNIEGFAAPEKWL